MTTPDNWRKSSYSGGGDGNNCVEIADRRTHIAVRDSKAPTKSLLCFPAGAFRPFLEALKNEPYSTVTDFARFRG
ncbi:DUF397 domain-containing protein [Streptomyces spinoverrucosus]|uniref:DUF397 domain-containing protein n=1 Tax=Streptomyces spinoverrucosus TaxID=284043 RepID=UPI0018C35CDA|nr:DUF397 domain-containing protein [Streptomyces spinoverrucosus]MBG0853144.1 DUF397 domain-containing protein [Streptomyces spinoverrucosus]